MASAIGSERPTNVPDDLRDRACESYRSGASEDEPRATLLEHERRRQHASGGACLPREVRGRSRRARPSMLFICAPPRKTPEPEPRVDESAAAVPDSSTTEMWVVPVSLPRPDAP